MTVCTEDNEHVPECVEEQHLRLDPVHLREGVVQLAGPRVTANLVRKGNVPMSDMLDV